MLIKLLLEVDKMKTKSLWNSSYDLRTLGDKCEIKTANFLFPYILLLEDAVILYSPEKN